MVRLSRHQGGGWALGKLKSLWGKAKTDLADVQSDLAAIKSRVTAIEAELHIKTPVATVASAPAAISAAVAGAPVVDSVGVQQSPNSNA